MHITKNNSLAECDFLLKGNKCISKAQMIIKKLDSSFRLLYLNVCQYVHQLPLAEKTSERNTRTFHCVKGSVFGVILLCILPHSDWIGRDAEYLSVFGPNAGKSDHNNSKFGHFLRSVSESILQNISRK